METKKLTDSQAIKRAMECAIANSNSVINVAVFINAETSQRFFVLTEKQLNKIGVTLE